MTVDEYILLVYKNLKGEISSDEFELLNKTTAEDSQLAQTRFDIEDVWDFTGEEKILISDSDTNALFDKIVGSTKKSAAENNKAKQLKDQVKKTSVFTLGRVISSIAAVLVLVFGAKFLFQSNTTTYNKAGVYTLADNSTVTLRRGTLKVKKFEPSQRRVELRGEAYFEIAKEPDRPFVVAGKYVKIQVLGTSFLVKEHNENTYIDLTEGKISTIDTRSLDTEVLTAGMKAHHTSEGKINLITEYNNLSSWREGFYQYRNTKLGKVVEELSIIFDTQITIANLELAECSFSGNISGGKLEDILAPIGKKYKMDILQQESQWILSDGVCN